MFKNEVLQNKEEIVNLVRNRWKQGKRPDGSIIGTYALFSYEQEKLRRNPLAGGNVDLINEGDLSKGLTVNYIREAFFSIFSTDEKAVSIAVKYGLDVYGLNKQEELMVINEAMHRVDKKLVKFVYG